MEKLYKQLRNNEIIDLDLIFKDRIETNKSFDLLNKNLFNINKLNKYLNYNSSLTHLNLKYNKIKNINKLIENLKYNNTLKELLLNNNNININDLNKLKEKYKNIKIKF